MSLRIRFFLFFLFFLALFPIPVRSEAGPKTGNLPALQAEVQRLRELEFLRPVQSREMSLEEAGQEVRQMLGRDLETPSARGRELFLQSLGLLPEGTSLESSLVDLFGEQIRGLYDPRKQVFVVVREVPDSLPSSAISAAVGLDLGELYTLHELVHALQDQHFGLLALEEGTRGNFDALMALRALLEGDANLVMFQAAARRMGLDAGLVVSLLGSGPPPGLPGLDAYPQFQGAPRFLQEFLTMPYFQGMGFVAALHRDGGWPRVGAAFRELPASTEHILHPEKFLRGDDPPLRVDLSDLPGKFGSYALLSEDTAGEFLIRVWGEENLGIERGRQAAAGWGGDSWRLYATDQDRFFLWVTAWDTEADAREFEALARKARAAHTDRIERNGARVLVISGAPGELVQAISSAAGKAKIHP
jgi:hypothetical protein